MPFPAPLRIVVALAAGFVFRAQARPSPASPPATCDFRTFTGVCQGSSAGAQLGAFVGWDREDIAWDKLEPRPGEWNQAELEKWGRRVLALQAQGIRFLPILDYCALWAVDTEPRVALATDDMRVELQRTAAGEFVKAVYKKAYNGSWVRESAKKVKPRAQWALAAGQVPAWEAYVRRVVTYLSAPPYNVKYFQIWNEAHPASSFWQFASLDDYMRRIHLPAAKVIHELGGKVVYGGWPDCGAISDYVKLLDRHDAWKTIDVLDVHYFPISAFDALERAARKRGFGNIALWQTEVGFVNDTAAIPNQWPRFLAWALRHDWNEPDKYKLFWFAAVSPDDPKAYGYGHSLLRGRALAAHGLALQTLAASFSSGSLSRYPGTVSSRPALSEEAGFSKPSIEVFRVGDKRIVAAVHLAREKDDPDFARWGGPSDGKHPFVGLRFDRLPSSSIKSIRRVDMAGVGRPLAISEPGDVRCTTMRVPVLDADDSPARDLFRNASMLTFLVEIELK